MRYVILAILLLSWLGASCDRGTKGGPVAKDMGEHDLATLAKDRDAEDPTVRAYRQELHRHIDAIADLAGVYNALQERQAKVRGQAMPEGGGEELLKRLLGTLETNEDSLLRSVSELQQELQ